MSFSISFTPNYPCSFPHKIKTKIKTKIKPKMIRFHNIIAIRSESRPSDSNDKSKLGFGSPIIIIDTPQLIKTAASVPCLRVNDGLVKPGDVGRMKKYSDDVFQTSLFGEKMAILCGPQGNKFIFSNERTWWPESLKKILHFTEYQQDSVVDVVASASNLVHDFLKPDTLKQYIPIMDIMAQEHIDKEWANHQQVKVYPLSKTYTFDVACRLLLNVVDPVQIKKVADPFLLMSNGMFSVPINLPGTAYNLAIKSRKMVHEQLLKIIRDRRNDASFSTNQETEGCDLLSKMLLETNQNGEFLSDNEISSIIISLLVASYESTSSTLTFALKHLAEYPHIYNEVLKEQNEIDKTKGHGDLLTWKDIEKMKYSWNVVRETLRLMPTGPGAFRETIEDSVFAGFKIPKGWKIFWNVHTTYKNPKYFPNPEKFDPTRFEGKGPAPYTFVPFGGGPRMCPGKEYARLEILVFLINIIRRYKLERILPNEKIAFRVSPVPVNGLPVRLYPTGN